MEQQVMVINGNEEKDGQLSALALVIPIMGIRDKG